MANKRTSIGIGAMVIGMLGFIAGIILLFTGENKFIGIFGSIASAGIAIKGFGDWRKNKAS